MPNPRWHAATVSAELALDLRIPALRLTWPSIPCDASTWRDEAAFGLDLLAALSPWWRVVDVLAGSLAPELRAAVRSAGEQETEQPRYEQRSWGRIIEQGFLPGDLDSVDALTVTAAGAHVVQYAHSYGVRSGEYEARLTLAELLDPGCPIRSVFAACLSRVDAYVGLLLDLTQRGDRPERMG